MVVDVKIVTLKSGKRLFVDVTDGPDPAAPAIFFLHGLGSSTSFYEAPILVSELSLKFKLVRYDFDGSGLSPLSSETLTIDGLVEDLREVMDYVEVGTAAGIVAHSMSGLVATTFAARYPNRVEKLFLIGPMSAMTENGKRYMMTRASRVRASGVSAIVNTVVFSATSQQTKANSIVSLAVIRSLVLGTSPEAYAAACQALAEGIDPDYSAITAETLVLQGSEDYIARDEYLEPILKGIGEAKARKTIITETGHWHCVERPEQVARIWDEFFL